MKKHGNATHQDTGSAEYKAWIGLRCKRRELTCDRWNQSYEAFLEDMGRKPPGLVLGRLDRSKPYLPDNCEWMTQGRMMLGVKKPRPHL